MSFAPEEIAMVDVPDHGRRPFLKTGIAGQGSVDAMKVCPGIDLEHKYDPQIPGLIKQLEAAWGPIYGIWEGHATDVEIRFAGSSGGAATALALYCIERAGLHGVLHTAARSDISYLNHTVLSRTRQELLAATGSRYAPASPCDGLQMVEDAPTPCVFIGKPCDVAAVDKARALRPALDRKIGLTIAFFCAGTPSTQGTLEMLKSMGVDDPDSVVSLRYRGNGWPGNATAVVRLPDGREETRQLTYEQSWGEVLTKHVQWRCRICPDHTGEFADISVGDPWNNPPKGGEAGRSLIVVRTARGQAILAAAIAARYIQARRVAPETLPRAQPNLLRARASVWGRLVALQIAGVPAPHFRRIPMARHWLRQLIWQEKIKSILGTFKRIQIRKLRHRCMLKRFKSEIVCTDESDSTEPAQK